jgi:hypothetical protein
VEVTDLEANPEETEAMVERQEISNEEAVVHSMRAWHKEAVACQETTEACLDSKEPNPDDMEHREVPTEEAAVKSSGTMKKWHRGRHPAAGRHGEPKELTRGDCGSRGKLAAAYRKLSRHAAVAWRKRNVLRNIRTQGNRGPRQELGAAGIRMTRCAKEHGCKRQTEDDAGKIAHKGQTHEKRRWKCPECKYGLRDRDF